MEVDSDDPLEDPEDGHWMSYDELGQLRGIERASAVKLALRSGWRRVRGNDGSARVYVRGDFLKPHRKRPRDVSPGQSTGLSHAIKAFEAGLTALREQLALANGRVEQVEQGREAERQRADRAVESDAAAWWARSRWQRVRAAWRGRA
jgi:hypothetical protein